MSGRSTNAPRVGGGLVARERLELRGAAAPADEALLATERLQQAGSLTGIEVLDPVLPADARCCSFKAMGRL